jgi:hypothetical protein
MQMITRGRESEGLDVRELKVQDKGGDGLDINDREVMILSFLINGFMFSCLQK